MGKQTDYKKLWRNEKEARIKANNRILELEGLIETQGDIIKKLKKGSGKSKKM